MKYLSSLAVGKCVLNTVPRPVQLWGSSSPEKYLASDAISCPRATRPLLARTFDLVLSDFFKQLKDCHAQGVGYDFHGVQCGIGLAALQTAQVRLVEAATLAEHRLAHASGLAQAAHTRAKLDSEWGIHAGKYLRYALIRINTNSHKLVCVCQC